MTLVNRLGVTPSAFGQRLKKPILFVIANICIFFQSCPYTELRMGDISSVLCPEKPEELSQAMKNAGAMAQKRGKYGKRTEKDTGGKDCGQGGVDRGSDSPDRIGEAGTGGDEIGRAHV